VKSASWQAQIVTVGDFHLAKPLIDKISGATRVDLSELDLDAIKMKLTKPVLRNGEELYIGADPEQPAIGDLRISLTEVLPQMVSIIAQQSGTAVQAYR